MTPQDTYARVNRLLETSLTPYLDASRREEIAAKYGHETTDIAYQVYNAAMHAPVDWQTQDMDGGLRVMHALLDERYSWLTVLARRALNYAFIMNWK